MLILMVTQNLAASGFLASRVGAPCRLAVPCERGAVCPRAVQHVLALDTDCRHTLQNGRWVVVVWHIVVLQKAVEMERKYKYVWCKKNMKSMYFYLVAIVFKYCSISWY